MKKALFIAVLFVSFAVLTGFSSNGEFSVDIGAGYAVSSGDKVDAVAEKLGLPQDTVKSYFENGNLRFIAVSDDKLTQIKLTAYADEFSSAVYDFAGLSGEQLLSLYGSVSDSVSVVKGNGRGFVKTVEVHKDSGGIYASTQYSTVANGKNWLLSCYNPGNKTSADIERVFSSLTFADNSAGIESINSQIEEYQAKKNWVLPFIIVMCAVLAVGGVELFFNLRKNSK